jgi:alpha-1,2-mannosyltransferase
VTTQDSVQLSSSASAAPVAIDAELVRRQRFYAAFSILLIAPLLVWIYRPAADGLDVIGYPIGRDFINVWSGPQLAFGGQLATLFDFSGYERAIGVLFGQPLPFTIWSYPLFTLPVFWPLGQLPYFWALATWTFGLFALFATVTLSQIEPAKRGLALVVLTFAPACLINIIGGQNGFLSATLLLGGILVLDRQPVLAGVLFGLLTFKPQLGAVLPFALLALGAWRTIASAVVTVLVLVAASIALFGIEPWRQYFEIVGPFLVQGMRDFHGFYKFMMASVLAGGRTFGLSYPISLAIQIAVSLPVLIAACWAVRRTSDPCRRAFVLATAAPLITPYAFNYDLPMVAAVLTWIMFGRLPWRPEWSVLYLLGWMTPVALMYANMLGLGVAPLVLILLFAASLYEAVGAPARLRQEWPSDPSTAHGRPAVA